MSITLAEIPQALLDEVREKLWAFTVAVFGVDGTQPVYRGTATCVAAGGAPTLLTAAHVWESLPGRRFALSLEPERLLLPIRKDIVEPRLLSDSTDPEWGPDLALIRLPELCASKIRCAKAFYSMDRRRADSVAAPVRPHFGLWAVIGAPEEQSTFGDREAVLRTSVFASGIVAAHERGQWDYLDLSFDHEGRPDLPHSYGGISGSGLWQIPITKSATTGSISWTESVHLEGVAFYQKFTSKQRGVIRCHGRKSLDSHALEGMPNQAALGDGQKRAAPDRPSR